jgi:hypothetical protein
MFIFYVGVPTNESEEMAVFWVVAPCSLVEIYRPFIALMMKAASTSETSVNFYQEQPRRQPSSYS